MDVIVALTDSDLAGFSAYNRTVKIWNPLTITPSGQADLNQNIKLARNRFKFTNLLRKTFKRLRIIIKVTGVSLTNNGLFLIQ